MPETSRNNFSPKSFLCLPRFFSPHKTEMDKNQLEANKNNFGEKTGWKSIEQFNAAKFRKHIRNWKKILVLSASGETHPLTHVNHLREKLRVKLHDTGLLIQKLAAPITQRSWSCFSAPRPSFFSSFLYPVAGRDLTFLPHSCSSDHWISRSLLTFWVLVRLVP